MAKEQWLYQLRVPHSQKGLRLQLYTLIVLTQD